MFKSVIVLSLLLSIFLNKLFFLFLGFLLSFNLLLKNFFFLFLQLFLFFNHCFLNFWHLLQNLLLIFLYLSFSIVHFLLFLFFIKLGADVLSQKLSAHKLFCFDVGEIYIHLFVSCKYLLHFLASVINCCFLCSSQWLVFSIQAQSSISM